jgi:hypothetical protein
METLPPAGAALEALLDRVAALPAGACDEATLRAAGEALFSWLLSGSLEDHLRLAWDRAARAGRGLRIRLSIDPPEIAAWPWELLYDPQRDHTFATAIATPLVRYLDQTSLFGAPTEQEAELPLDLLLVLPSAANLNLAEEKRLIEEAVAGLKHALHLRVLPGPVTRTALADALLLARYDIVHVSGHGAFLDGQGYVELNLPDGSPDWVDGNSLSRIFSNHPHLKLVILNVCRGGQVAEGTAFRGLAPQLVRRGIPAVVAMQYPLTDQAGLTFAREFYKQLSTGENAGQIDVAITHGRNMLAVLYPGSRSFATPVLYTHASDGVIFTLPQEPAVEVVLSAPSESARLAMFTGSIEASMEFDEDWAMAEPAQLNDWRQTLLQAECAYQAHLANLQPAVQHAARHGLALIESRLAALEIALMTGHSAG